MRPHGRARVSSKNPQAFAICDRCAMLYNHVDLQWQFDWAGASLINKRMLVCRPCLDTPQEQLRAIILPADPTPIVNPRVEPYSYDSQSSLAEVNFTLDPQTNIPIPSAIDITTDGGITISAQPVGRPLGLDQNATPPQYLQKAYNVKLPVLSIASIGTNVITVTCSTVHNLTTGDQVYVAGVTVSEAAGYYTIVVTTATAFTYSVFPAIPAQNLLGNETIVATTLVGLPYGQDEIPVMDVSGNPL